LQTSKQKGTVKVSATTAYLTPREAAELLRVDRQTIYNRVNDGRLQAFRLAGGNRWRIPAKAVNAQLTKPERKDK
jgi:excisionase family DNA binding protein